MKKLTFLAFSIFILKVCAAQVQVEKQLFNDYLSYLDSGSKTFEMEILIPFTPDSEYKNIKLKTAYRGIYPYIIESSKHYLTPQSEILFWNDSTLKFTIRLREVYREKKSMKTVDYKISYTVTYLLNYSSERKNWIINPSPY